MVEPAKNTICLWCDRGAEEAARFYAETFPDSFVGAVHRAPGDNPSCKEGDVKRAFDAMMTMRKINVATIEAAICG